MEVRYVFLAAQIIVNAFPQCARSFSVDNADTRQMGEISVIEIFVEFGNRFIHRFSEQIDLGRNRGSLGKLRFSAACAGDGRASDDSLVDQHKVGDMHFGPHDTHLDEEISLRIRAGADSTFDIHA